MDRRTNKTPAIAALLAVGLLVACSGGGDAPGASTASAPSGTASAPVASPAADAGGPADAGAGGAAGGGLPREGQAIARSARGDALYVAQQDSASLHIVSLPLDPAAAAREVPLPGRPSQVLVLHDQVLVTVRDPAMLLVLAPDETAGLAEKARVPLPDDAFGMALAPDGGQVLVTSAWAHAVSAVDLAQRKVRWTVDVAREPRGIVVTPDGKRAYVTHLVGAGLTRIDDLTGSAGDASPSPRVTRVSLPAAPLRARGGVKEDATLSYTGVLSPDGARLFVPRHALNAEGKRAWSGQPVVDVLLTAGDTALAQPATRSVPYTTKELEEARQFGTRFGPFADLTFGGGFPIARDPFIQPRAAVYRASSRTLLVASEGTDSVVELDALAIEPAAHVLHRHPLRGWTWTPRAGLQRAKVRWREDGVLFRLDLEDGRSVLGHEDKGLLDGGSGGKLVGIEWRKRGTAEVTIVEREPDDTPGATKCGAPSGIALSADERAAWVLCRTTWGVAEIALDADKDMTRAQTISPKVKKLADDPLPAEAALGRRLFHDAADGILSGGFACAGCHPEGRDDGHVWQEIDEDEDPDHPKRGAEPCGQYLAAPIWPFFFPMEVFDTSLRYGAPRQTPMLAGRVRSAGPPFGWRGKSPDLASRVIRGSALHAWTLPDLSCGGYNMKARAIAIAAFVKSGLVPPPSRKERPLTAEEQRGKAVFEDPKTACATCHAPATGYTDRGVVPFAAPPPVFERSGPVKSFEDERDRMFKTPSLLFVGGTPPYFHDGTAATLEEVIEQNRDRMGKTDHLSPEDRAALAAFLRTL